MKIYKLKLLFLLLWICCIQIACKPDSSKNNLKNDDEELGETTVQIGAPIPPKLQLFSEILVGNKQRMHDAYFSKVLPEQLPNAEFSKNVVMKWKQQLNDLHGSVQVENSDTYRGIAIGTMIIVFKKQVEIGGVAEMGPWWIPFSVYPRSILGDKSLEEKIQHCLNTKIYEKKEIGEALSMVSTADFFASLLPGYTGAEKVFYGKNAADRFVGTMWIIGDVATLGMSSKIKTVAKVSNGVVIATVFGRGMAISSDLNDRKATFADVANMALLTVEGGLAAFSIIKLKTRTPPAASGLDPEEVIAKTFEDTGKVAVKDLHSAEALSGAFNRSPSDILKTGLLREEVEQLVGRKLTRIGERVNGRLILPEDLMTKSVLIQIERIKGAVSNVGHLSIRIGGMAAQSHGPFQKLKLSLGGGTRLRNEITLFKLDIPPAAIEELKKKLASSPVLGTGTLGCANGVFKVLEEVVGVTVKNPSWLYGVRTYNTIRDILAQGLVNKIDGTKVGYSIYSSHLDNSDKLLQRAMKTDFAVAGTYPVSRLIFASLFFTIGDSFYVVIDSALADELGNVDTDGDFKPVDPEILKN